MDYQSAKLEYRKIKKIEGWFSKEAAMLLALLNEIQRKNGVRGDIFEIGVHHGKSALFLHALLTDAEQLGVCDLFDNQQLNLSGSGLGDKQKFLNNCATHLNNNRITILEKSSRDLSINEIGASYRMFHVDGGHSSEEALKDLELAANAVQLGGGIIVLDDPFRSEWPGVTEAAIAFLEKSPRFSALAVGFNKLIMAEESYNQRYGRALDEAYERSEYGLHFPWAYKRVTFVNKELRCFFMPTYLQNPTVKVKAYSWLKKMGLK